MTRPAEAKREISIAIIGAGASGLCMAIALKKAGYEHITIFEKSNRVGGTWNDNRYPGSGCDIMSHLYCYSFEPNPDWTRRFSLQPEIQKYFEHCAEKYGVLPHIRFETEIASAHFDADEGYWRIRTKDGKALHATVLVSGSGQLNRPHIPKIAGVESFSGEKFHSARWPETHDINDKNVALIGSGASAIQIVPEIARRAKKLTVFQRTPSYVIRRKDRAYYGFEKWAFRNVPFVLWLYRLGIYLSLEIRFFALLSDSFMSKIFKWIAVRNLRREVADPELRKKLTPDYPPGCKRTLISDDFYRAVSQPNVEVITEPIDHVTEHAIVTKDGVKHPADTLVLATGFETMTFLAPIEILGRNGAALSDVWREGAEAHNGVAVSGFPNLFLLYGPNTNLGHNSIIFMIECQVRYAMACIREIDRLGARFIDVRREAMAQFNTQLQNDLAKTAWAGSCQSWYKNDAGKITNNWSGFTLAYWWCTRKPDFDEHEIVRAPLSSAPPRGPRESERPPKRKAGRRKGEIGH